MARYEDARQAARKLRDLAVNLEREPHKIRWNIRISIQRPKGEPGLTAVSYSNLR
jgi:hypothetical protein